MRRTWNCSLELLELLALLALLAFLVLFVLALALLTPLHQLLIFQPDTCEQLRSVVLRRR